MTEGLTRRRSSGPGSEQWLIFYSGVNVGQIAERSGVPADEDQWGWQVGFYPGTRPGTHMNGTAADFEACKAAFDAAWAVYLPLRTEAEFQECRDWHAARGERFPPCGASGPAA